MRGADEEGLVLGRQWLAFGTVGDNDRRPVVAHRGELLSGREPGSSFSRETRSGRRFGGRRLYGPSLESIGASGTMITRLLLTGRPMSGKTIT